MLQAQGREQGQARAAARLDALRSAPAPGVPGSRRFTKPDEPGNASCGVVDSSACAAPGVPPPLLP